MTEEEQQQIKPTTPNSDNDEEVDEEVIEEEAKPLDLSDVFDDRPEVSDSESHVEPSTVTDLVEADEGFKLQLQNTDVIPNIMKKEVEKITSPSVPLEQTLHSIVELQELLPVEVANDPGFMAPVYDELMKLTYNGQRLFKSKIDAEMFMRKLKNNKNEKNIAKWWKKPFVFKKLLRDQAAKGPLSPMVRQLVMNNNPFFTE